MFYPEGSPKDRSSSSNVHLFQDLAKSTSYEQSYNQRSSRPLDAQLLEDSLLLSSKFVDDATLRKKQDDGLNSFRSHQDIARGYSSRDSILPYALDLTNSHHEFAAQSQSLRCLLPQQEPALDRGCSRLYPNFDQMKQSLDLPNDDDLPWGRSFTASSQEKSLWTHDVAKSSSQYQGIVKVPSHCDGGGIFGQESVDFVKQHVKYFTRNQLVELVIKGISISDEIFQIAKRFLDSDPYRRRLIVKGLYYFTTEETFRQYFSKFGELESASIIKHSDGRSQGYGFLIYKHYEDAENVLQHLHIVDGRSLSVFPTSDQSRKLSPPSVVQKPIAERRKLFVRNVCAEITEKMLATEFSAYGPLEECVIIRTNKNESKGYGFVTFVNSADAKTAAQVSLRVINGWVVFVSFATSRGRKGRSHQSPSSEA